jgi:hypothetical protein
LAITRKIPSAFGEYSERKSRFLHFGVRNAGLADVDRLKRQEAVLGQVKIANPGVFADFSRIWGNIGGDEDAISIRFSELPRVSALAAPSKQCINFEKLASDIEAS